MTALAESLWNPDVPWEDVRQRYLVSAYGEHADRAFDAAADHLRRTEPRYSTYIDTMLALRFVQRMERRFTSGTRSL